MTDEAPGGPLDVAALAVMARRAQAHPLVRTWRFRPDALSPRTLELELDETQYPAAVTAARLEVRWFEGGEYAIHYVETRPDEDWQCRWDRHPKPDAPGAHFHPPPDAAATVEASDIDGTYHLDVLFAVLEWIQGRVARPYEG